MKPLFENSGPVFTDKILAQIRHLQSSNNSVLADYIECTERIRNLLLEIGISNIAGIEPDEILQLLYVNNRIQLLLNDFKVPEG